MWVKLYPENVRKFIGELIVSQQIGLSVSRKGKRPERTAASIPGDGILQPVRREDRKGVDRYSVKGNASADDLV